MEGQTLSEKSEKMIEAILESYKEYPVTVRMDTENIVNKNVLIQVLEELRRILFPGFFDTNRVRSEYIKYLVGDRMEFVQYHLRKQIARVLGNDETCDQCPKSDLSNKAEKIVEEFFSKIPMIREYLYTDVQAAYDGDPAAYSTDEVIFSYPGIFAITVYRIAHELVLLGVPLIPRIMTEYAHSITGIDIHPGAQIGHHFTIDHGTGVVIGATSIIGNNVKLYQGVTLGAKSFPLDNNGNPIKGIPRHPILEDDVIVYSNATILGRVTIGKGATVGGNIWVTENVPAGSRIVQRKNKDE